MKTKITWVLAVAMALTFTGCKSYKKTKSGLVYKIFSGGSKDSLIKIGNIAKFHFTRKLNDSVLYTSFDKIPSYIPLQNDPGLAYSPVEVFFLARKGDSIITIELVDTLMKKGMTNQLPPNIKKGDRITTYIKILNVFRSDSTAMPDYTIEMQKDKPRQEKEMKETLAKAAKERKEQLKKDIDEMKKSGELDKVLTSMQSYLTGKKISAQKTNAGTFVLVNEKGTGEPIVEGKFVSIKYSGKILETDSVFQSSEYTFQVGMGEVIAGWDDGLKLFNKGGKGVLYVPAFLAYGKNPAPNGKINQALVFDVEVLNVSDTPQQAVPPAPPQNQ